MRRTLIIAGLVVTAVGGAAYYYATNWAEYDYYGTQLMVNLGRPDAVIRTASLSRLPRDLLQVPIAKDVLTEDLVFYYEQNEDRLGFSGAIKRIAYEHQLGWTDQILASALNEPAEVALWRDGKGALRHFAVVMRRNALSKVIQEAAAVALKDNQLKVAGEIATARGKATAYALELNPRRTLLLVAIGDRIVVLSDPGLLFGKGNKMLPAARNAIVDWLENDGALAKQFALDQVPPAAAAQAPKPMHTFAVGAPTLTLGYGAFMPGFKGLRFDFGHAWSTSVWIDPQSLPAGGLGNAALWRAAPANPGACVVLPVDWNAVQKILSEAPKKPALPKADALAAFGGPALACWYGESTLYSPVFIAYLADGIADRNATLQNLANWAIAANTTEDGKVKVVADKKPGNALHAARTNGKDDVMIWRKTNPTEEDEPAAERFAAPTVAARGRYVVFSPDGALVDLVLDTLARTNPSVADQMPANNATLMLVTPSRLSAMAEKEVLAALAGPGDANLQAAAQTHLPSRMKALATYPPYRLDLPASDKLSAGWQRVEWRTSEQSK